MVARQSVSHVSLKYQKSSKKIVSIEWVLTFCQPQAWYLSYYWNKTINPDSNKCRYPQLTMISSIPNHQPSCWFWAIVSKNLNVIQRPVLKFTKPLVESSWCEIISERGRPNIIVGYIYRHPTCNLPAFTSEFKTLLKEISQYDIYILGDFNIDFLKYSEHLLTEEYLNMLYSNKWIDYL